MEEIITRFCSDFTILFAVTGYIFELVLLINLKSLLNIESGYIYIISNLGMT